MKAEIISIGSEITTGSVLNTNSKFIANRLLEIGIETYYHTSVDDNEDRLIKVIRTALDRVNLIITTGGLGPTADDLSKETISQALGIELESDSAMEEDLKSKFMRINQEMPSNNLKQAKKPIGSNFLNNSIGTAPGIYINLGNNKIIMLPGPPKEMELMFDKEVVPLLHESNNIIKKSINLIGIGESQLEMQLKDLINAFPNINISTFVNDEGVEIRIIGNGESLNSLQEEVNSIIKIISSRFDKYVYGFDNIPLANIVFEILMEKGYKIGFCESCTGGLISSRFSQISGVSEVFDRSIVTYSNLSKVEEVGVSKATLEEYGAVSEETAMEMANGLLNKSKNLDIVLSVTGIAGPNGGTKEKPVGLVYLCISSRKLSKVIKYNLTGTRKSIQEKVTTRAFSELRKFLLNL